MAEERWMRNIVLIQPGKGICIHAFVGSPRLTQMKASGARRELEIGSLVTGRSRLCCARKT